MPEEENSTSEIAEALERKIERLVEMHPSDIAAKIDDWDIDDIRVALRALSDETVAEVIPELPQEVQTELMENMRVSRVAEIIPEMYSDDAADALAEVSPERLQSIMKELPDEEYEEISEILEYPEDSAGGIMQKEIIAVRDDLTLGAAREAIRQDEDQDEDSSIYVYVIDSESRLRGVLRLRDLLFRDLRLKVNSVMLTEVRSVSVHADQEEIANLFQKYNFIALPVVDDFGKLVGMVTSDDVMDVIQEEATEDMQRMVGLTGEESATTHWSYSVKKRLPWLCVNLGTAFLASGVIWFFESSIAQYAVLAILFPIVAGQGGNAGSQTLTIVVRSLALGEIEGDEWRKVLLKEIIVGTCSGIAIGMVVGTASWILHGSIVIGIVICVAMLLNMIAAALSGVLVPMSLRALKIDPALASSIMVTTVTDVVGIFAFLSLATLAAKTFPL